MRLTLILRVFLPFAFGYWLSYLFRSINAVIAPDLIAGFGLRSDDLGLLTGAYFLTFALVQVPLGVVLDRVGSRRTEATLLAFAAAGAAVFATADGFTGLFVGRALIGLGVSSCLMAAFRAFVTWFPARQLPLVNGCQMAAGGLGAITATTPVQALLSLTDWRGVFLGISGLTVAAMLLIVFVVPREPAHAARESWRDLGRGVGRVYGSSLFWRIAPVTVPTQAGFLAVQGLWTGPWLADVAGLTRPAAADILFLIAATMIAGFVGMGWLAARVGRLGISPMAVALGGIVVFMVAEVLIIVRPLPGVPFAWLLFGFFGTSTILPYAALSQRFPTALAGRVNTCLNVLVFVAAFSLQWGIGAIIRSWPPDASGGYPAVAYDTAFACLVVLQGLGIGWYALFRRGGVPAA